MWFQTILKNEENTSPEEKEVPTIHNLFGKKIWQHNIKLFDEITKKYKLKDSNIFAEFNTDNQERALQNLMARTNKIKKRYVAEINDKFKGNYNKANDDLTGGILEFSNKDRYDLTYKTNITKENPLSFTTNELVNIEGITSQDNVLKITPINILDEKGYKINEKILENINKYKKENKKHNSLGKKFFTTKKVPVLDAHNRPVYENKKAKKITQTKLNEEKYTSKDANESDKKEYEEWLSEGKEIITSFNSSFSSENKVVNETLGYVKLYALLFGNMLDMKKTGLLTKQIKIKDGKEQISELYNKDDKRLGIFRDIENFVKDTKRMTNTKGILEDESQDKLGKINVLRKVLEESIKNKNITAKKNKGMLEDMAEDLQNFFSGVNINLSDGLRNLLVKPKSRWNKKLGWKKADLVKYGKNNSEDILYDVFSALDIKLLIRTLSNTSTKELLDSINYDFNYFTEQLMSLTDDINEMKSFYIDNYDSLRSKKDISDSEIEELTTKVGDRKMDIYFHDKYKNKRINSIYHWLNYLQEISSDNENYHPDITGSSGLDGDTQKYIPIHEVIQSIGFISILLEIDNNPISADVETDIEEIIDELSEMLKIELPNLPTDMEHEGTDVRVLLTNIKQVYDDDERERELDDDLRVKDEKYYNTKGQETTLDDKISDVIEQVQEYLGDFIPTYNVEVIVTLPNENYRPTEKNETPLSRTVDKTINLKIKSHPFTQDSLLEHKVKPKLIELDKINEPIIYSITNGEGDVERREITEKLVNSNLFAAQIKSTRMTNKSQTKTNYEEELTQLEQQIENNPEVFTDKSVLDGLLLLLNKIHRTFKDDKNKKLGGSTYNLIQQINRENKKRKRIGNEKKPIGTSELDSKSKWKDKLKKQYNFEKN